MSPFSAPYASSSSSAYWVMLSSGVFDFERHTSWRLLSPQIIHRFTVGYFLRAATMKTC